MRSTDTTRLSKVCTRRMAGSMITLLLALVLAAPVPAQTPGEKPSGPVSQDLLTLLAEYEAYLESGNPAPFTPSNPLVSVRDSLVLIDATAAGDAVALRAALEILGLQRGATFGRMVSGWFPISAIGDLENIDNLQSIRPASRITTDTEADEPGIPERFALGQNFPNPFNPTTTIPVDLTDSGAVVLYVYDVAGRRIDTLIDGVLPAGRHEVVWEAKNLPTGVYFYRLTAGDFSQVRQMMLVK